MFKVPHWHLAGVTAEYKQLDILHAVASVLAPATVRGWVSNWSDIYGRTGYRLTSTGRKFLDNPIKPTFDVEPIFNARLGDKYLASFGAEYNNLATLKPRHESYIPISLPSGDWRDRAKGIPGLFISSGEARTPAEILKSMEAS